MAFWQWSKTASNNSTADATISVQEGIPPSIVNDGMRAMMARLAEYRDDISGNLSAGGTASAYTVTTNEGFSSTPANGQKISITPTNTNAANVTLQCDGGTAFPIQVPAGVNLGPGVMVANTAYDLVFILASSAWMLKGLTAGNPWLVPLGSMLDFTGTTSPNANFVLPYGQAISRSTYATYFSMVGTTYGAGDGVSTFNVPDLRGRLTAGVDNMGGSAANRITSGGSGITGTTLGAAGGAQNEVIAQGNLPNINLPLSGISVSTSTSTSTSVTPSGTATSTVTDNGHTHTVTDPGHIHAVTDNGHSHGITEPNSGTGHNHGITDPQHSHTYNSAVYQGANAISGGGAIQGSAFSTPQTGSSSTGITINNATTGISINSATTGISINNHTTGITNQSATTGITVATSLSLSSSASSSSSSSSSASGGVAALGGSGNALTTMPPTIMVNKLLRIL